MASNYLCINRCTLYDNQNRENSHSYLSCLHYRLASMVSLRRLFTLMRLVVYYRMHCNCTSGYYICHLFMAHIMTFGFNMSSFWLIFSGAVTAIPLILFSGAKRIPLSLTGFIQYVGPTIMFILGIFVFKEKFDINQLITFIFIWIGIILYSISQYMNIKRNPIAK